MSPISQINSGLSTADILKQKSGPTLNTSGGASFGDVLKQSMNETNTLHEKSEKAMADMATGQVKDLHQAALAIGKAEVNMKTMLEVRNKAINAYKELLRTQM